MRNNGRFCWIGVFLLWGCYVSIVLSAETVSSVIESPRAERLAAVFHFSQEADLPEVEELADSIIKSWPARWDGDSEPHWLPVFVRWAELDETGLKRFVQKHRSVVLQSIYKEALSYRENGNQQKHPSEDFEKWLETDFSAALKWVEENETATSPEVIEKMAKAIGESEDPTAAKRWAEARKGLAARQSGLIGWLVSLALVDAEGAWSAWENLAPCRAKHEGLTRILVEMAKKDPPAALAKQRKVRPQDEALKNQILRTAAKDATRFRYSGSEVFVTELAKRDLDAAVRYFEQNDLSDFKNFRTVIERVLLTDPEKAARFALKSSDAYSIKLALDALTLTDPGRAVEMVSGHQGGALRAVGRQLVLKGSPLAEEFLFHTHTEKSELDWERALFIVDGMLADPDKAAAIFEKYLPPLEINGEDKDLKGVRERIDRMVFEMCQLSLPRVYQLVNIVPERELKIKLAEVTVRGAGAPAVVSMFLKYPNQENNLGQLRILASTGLAVRDDFEAELAKNPEAAIADSIRAGLVDSYLADESEDSNQKALSHAMEITDRKLRDAVFRESIAPAFRSALVDPKLEALVEKSKLTAEEKKSLKEMLPKNKVIPANDPFGI